MIIGVYPSSAMDPGMAQLGLTPLQEEANDMVVCGSEHMPSLDPNNEQQPASSMVQEVPQQHEQGHCLPIGSDGSSRARPTPFVFSHDEAPPIRTSLSNMGAHPQRMSPDTGSLNSGAYLGSSPLSCSLSPWSSSMGASGAHSHPTASSLLAGSITASQQPRQLLIVDPHLKGAKRMTRSASSVDMHYTVPERRVRGGQWGRPSASSRDGKLHAGLSRTQSRDIWDMLGPQTGSPVSTSTTASCLLPNIYKVRSTWSLPHSMSYMSMTNCESSQQGPISNSSGGAPVGFARASESSLSIGGDAKVHGGALLASKEQRERCVHGGQPKHSTSMAMESPIHCGSQAGFSCSMGDLRLAHQDTCHQAACRSHSHPSENSLEASLSNASLMLRSSSLGLGCFAESTWAPVLSQLNTCVLPSTAPVQQPVVQSCTSLDANLACSSLESGKAYQGKVVADAGAALDLSRQNSCDLSNSATLMVMSRSPSLGVVYKVKLGSTPTAQHANSRGAWSCNNSIDEHVGPLEAAAMFDSPTGHASLLGTKLSRAMLCSSAHPSSMMGEGRVSLLHYVDPGVEPAAAGQLQAGGVSGSSAPRL